MKNFMKKNLALLLAFTLFVGLFPFGAQAASLETIADSVETVDTVNTDSKTVPIKISGERNYTYAYQVLRLINTERKNAGLSEVVMDESLLDTAMTRAAEVAVIIAASHVRPDGSECFTAYPESGFMAYGENIAAGQTSPKDVMNSWMNSEGHRANILASHYNAVGVGCYKVGNWYCWVQSFGTTDNVVTADKSNYTDGKKFYTINVTPSYLKLSVKLSKSTISKKSTAKVSVKLTNADFSDLKYALPSGQFTFTSSNKKVATVNSSGKITPHKKGKTKIKVKLSGSGRSVGTATLTVK